MGLLFTDFLLFTRPNTPAPGGGVASVFNHDVTANVTLNVYRQVLATLYDDVITFPVTWQLLLVTYCGVYQPMMLNEVHVRRADDVDTTALQLDYDGKSVTLKAINTTER